MVSDATLSGDGLAASQLGVALPLHSTVRRGIGDALTGIGDFAIAYRSGSNDIAMDTTMLKSALDSALARIATLESKVSTLEGN